MKSVTPHVIYLACILGHLTAFSTMATGETQLPNWQPQSSERLIKLPANYLKKSINHDFQESELGVALSDTNEKIHLKAQTLSDLQAAADQAEGDLRLELRHQLLAEKRAFVDLMANKSDLQRRYIKTKHRLLERMLGRLSQKSADLEANPARKELIAMQNAAQSRFQDSVAKVDMKLFQSSIGPESKYSRKYSENMAAIEKLLGRIQHHAMNDSANGAPPATKKEYLRQMLSETQSELSLIEQEETILGYMAKLVALDALALSEEAMDAEQTDSDLPATSGPATAVNLFLTN